MGRQVAASCLEHPWCWYKRKEKDTESQGPGPRTSQDNPSGLFSLQEEAGTAGAQAEFRSLLSPSQRGLPGALGFLWFGEHLESFQGWVKPTKGIHALQLVTHPAVWMSQPSQEADVPVGKGPTFPDTGSDISHPEFYILPRL